MSLTYQSQDADNGLFPHTVCTAVPPLEQGPQVGTNQSIVGPHPPLVPCESPQAVDKVEGKGARARTSPGELPGGSAVNVDLWAVLEQLQQSRNQTADQVGGWRL